MKQSCFTEGNEKLSPARAQDILTLKQHFQAALSSSTLKQHPGAVSSLPAPDALDEANIASHLDNDATEGDSPVQTLLAGLLNALRHNEVPMLEGLLQSLRGNGAPQEITTHFRRNFESLQEQGIMSGKTLDEEELMAMASRAAEPQPWSDTPSAIDLRGLSPGHEGSLSPSSDQTDISGSSIGGSVSSFTDQMNGSVTLPEPSYYPEVGPGREGHIKLAENNPYPHGEPTSA
ncbi:hypothetical protein PMZ80_005660 [Knufia obscura]|uniref:Uncharacterized protein n=2 Tax=Knufia TaxID=430999 RepID=A0AAN8EE88_9EURO|nr:hypothetical protein PMZ80_005660 [Knufia obscura]KAK5949418.1 hypothetical protein OHC33_009591 [Knufia fluminis]